MNYQSRHITPDTPDLHKVARIQFSANEGRRNMTTCLSKHNERKLHLIPHRIISYEPTVCVGMADSATTSKKNTT